MPTPSEHFGLKVIGVATTPPIAGFPAGVYDVIRVINLLPPAGKAYVTNKWFRETWREPLVVVEQFGATFEPNPSELTSLIRRIK
jgi:hypothetical protein